MEGAKFSVGLLISQQLVLSVTDRWEGTVDRLFLVHADEPSRIVGDRERLECVLDALLENAVEATGDAGQIWVGVSENDGHAQIRVADDGRGFSSAAAEHMFERFWTERGGDHRRGCGLGLAIVKSIVTAHGGTIDVARRDEITVFTIEFPVLDVSELAATAPRSDDTVRPRRLKIAS